EIKPRKTRMPARSTAFGGSALRIYDGAFSISELLSREKGRLRHAEQSVVTERGLPRRVHGAEPQVERFLKPDATIFRPGIQQPVQGQTLPAFFDRWLGPVSGIDACDRIGVAVAQG